MKKYNYKTIPDLLLDEEWQIKTNTIETNFKNIRDQICNLVQKKILKLTNLKKKLGTGTIKIMNMVEA